MHNTISDEPPSYCVLASYALAWHWYISFQWINSLTIQGDRPKKTHWTISLEIFGYQKCWHMVNCVFTPVFSKLHCKHVVYFFNDCHTICHVQVLFFLQLFSWKSVMISSSSHLSPVSISWKHQYSQSLQKNDVIIKFLCSGIYPTLIYGVCQVLKKKNKNKTTVFCIVPGVVWIRNVPLCIWTLCNHLMVMFGKAMNLWHIEPCWEKHDIGAVGFCNLLVSSSVCFLLADEMWAASSLFLVFPTIVRSLQQESAKVKSFLPKLLSVIVFSHCNRKLTKTHSQPTCSTAHAHLWYVELSFSSVRLCSYLNLCIPWCWCFICVK